MIGRRTFSRSSGPGVAGSVVGAHGRRSRLIGTLGLFAVLMVLWQLYGLANPVFASYPTAIAAAAWTVLVPQILPAFASTMVGFIAGIAISIPLAIVIGVAMGRVKLVEIILAPYVNALYVTPRIALIPVLVLWFGLEFNLRLAIVVLSSVFPMIVNIHTGMKHVDQELIDVGRSFTATQRQILRKIVVPSALPYVFAGLRIGTARALGGVIMAELTASFSGIGARLLNYGTFFETDRLMLTVICVGILGLLIARTVALVQSTVAPWSRAARSR